MYTYWKVISLCLSALCLIQQHNFILADDDYCYCSNNDNDNNDSSSNCEIKNDSNMQCPLYLAESSIPGAGMGLYTGKDVLTGSIIGYPEIAIPIFDMDDNIRHMIKSYAWQGYMHGINYESTYTTETLSPGIFAIINGHQGLANVQMMPTTIYDGLNMHRSKDAGSGAYTPYTNVQAFVTNGSNKYDDVLEKGTELFADYGDAWYTFEGRADKFKHVPLINDYVDADYIIEQFAPFLIEHVNDISINDMQKFWDFFKTVLPTGSNNIRDDDDDDDDDDEDEEQGIRQAILNLLPKLAQDVPKVFDAGGTAIYNAPKNFIRSAEWLQENGLCIGYLTSGISSIEQAGRGAFTTRPFTKGSIVSSTPLFHECYASEYVHYKINKDDDDDENYRIQLLLNYCFQHPESPILLCPYGSQTSLINHNSNEPNVKIQWSTSSYHNSTWTNNDEFTLDDLCDIKQVELVIDYIAIKEIKNGDEIFLDYGDLWNDAWNQYVQEWNDNKQQRLAMYYTYKSAYEYNKNEIIIKTKEDDDGYLYPSNILTECFFKYTDEDVDTNYQEIEFNITKKKHKAYEYTAHDHLMQLHNCTVYKRDITTHTNSPHHMHIYAVGMKLYYDSELQDDESIVYNVPRNAIRFVDTYYSSDMHLDYAFRHPIGFPDDMFPEKWKVL